MSLPTTSNSGLRTAALAQGRQNRTIRLTGIRSWFEAYRAAPLYSLALVFYMGLRTTAIFPESEGTVLPFWHPGYFGWYDIVFFCLMIGGAALSRLQVPRRALVVSVLFLVSIVVSSVSNQMEASLPVAALYDALLFWARFWVTFICTAALIERDGSDRVEKILFGVGYVLMASSIFVFRLQYGVFNRIYASGMTVGSFGQVLLILFLIAMIRNHAGVMLISLVFLILTFSRTALFLWIGSLGYFLFTRSKVRLSRRVLSGGLVMVLFVTSTIILLRYPEFQFVINERLNLDDIYTMNRRTEVWQYGIDLLLSKSVPLFGIGFNCSPSVLSDFISMPGDELNQVLYFPSFHSIFFEYAIGLGVGSVPIFVFLLWRIWRAWRSRSHLSFYIYSLFALSQCFDFSFYRPKEVIIWAAFLGLAEAEIVRQRKQTQTRSKALTSTSSLSAENRAEAATLS